MLKGIITLLFFQFLGECITKLFSLFIPGSVVAIILLMIFLIIRKNSFKSLDDAAFIHLKYLPIFFTPLTMGIITQIDIISKEFLAISISLVIGTILSLAISAKLMDWITNTKEINNEL